MSGDFISRVAKQFHQLPKWKRDVLRAESARHDKLIKWWTAEYSKWRVPTPEQDRKIRAGMRAVGLDDLEW